MTNRLTVRLLCTMPTHTVGGFDSQCGKLAYRHIHETPGGACCSKCFYELILRGDFTRDDLELMFPRVTNDFREGLNGNGH